MSWKPIETAPMDGTCVLLATSNHVFQGYYDNCDLAFYRGWHVPNNGDYTEGGYGNAYKCGDGEYPLPTHWRPFPKPPKEA